MQNGTNNSQELFMPGRIRMIIMGALGVAATTDAFIDQEKLDSLLAEVSRIMGRKIVLLETTKRGMRVSQLTSLIHKLQDQSKPLPEQPENPSSTTTKTT